MGRNGEFWRVVLTFLKCDHEIVHPQIWQDHFFAGMPGLDSKEKAATVVKHRFPDLDYGNCSDAHRKGKNDALLIAQWAKDHKK